MASKQTLREVYLAKRLTLSDKEYQLRNDLITRQLVEFINLNNFKSIHIFLSILTKKEFNTYPLIDWLKTRNTTIYVPKVHNGTDLIHYRLDENCIVEVNKWGIPEPIAGNSIKDLSIDAVIVPLLIADKKGNRIGYGKGYYDRFLKNINSVKIGVSLLTLLDEIPFIDENDVKLDYLVTPDDLIKVG